MIQVSRNKAKKWKRDKNTEGPYIFKVYILFVHLI